MPTGTSAQKTIGSTSAPRPGVALLKALRQLHLYLGVFAAPALLFFAFTGALQTANLHQASRTSDYKPPQWIAVLAQIHKNQTAQLPVRKTPGEPGKAAGPGGGAVAAKAPNASGQTLAPPRAPEPNRVPLKAFFLLVSLSFVTSVVSGVYLAYKYSRGKLLVSGLLVAGVIVPLVLLFV